MTRPVELRAREDASVGTAFAAFCVGERFGPLRFELEPTFIDEYIRASGIDESLYYIEGRAVAPPQVLTLFLMPTLHKRYPPLPGAVMATLEVELRNPIWRNEVTNVVSEGVIEEKFERRGRRYVTWSAEYRRAEGTVLAKITNTFVAPS